MAGKERTLARVAMSILWVSARSFVIQFVISNCVICYWMMSILFSDIHQISIVLYSIIVLMIVMHL